MGKLLWDKREMKLRCYETITHIKVVRIAHATRSWIIFLFRCFVLFLSLSQENAFKPSPLSSSTSSSVSCSKKPNRCFPASHPASLLHDPPASQGVIIFDATSLFSQLKSVELNHEMQMTAINPVMIRRRRLSKVLELARLMSLVNWLSAELLLLFLFPLVCKQILCMWPSFFLIYTPVHFPITIITFY